MRALDIPAKLGFVAACLWIAGACTSLGGQEGEDLEPKGPTTSDPSSGGTSTVSTGTGTGTGAGTGGGITTPTDDGDGTPGATDSGDTGDTGDTGTTGTPTCEVVQPTLYLSPDDSNSYATAVMNRTRVLDGMSPTAVRAYEFFNYYDFDVPAGPTGGASLTAEWLEDGLGREDYALQVHIGAESRDLAGRAPINLTFVLDTSCSMSGTPIAVTHDVCDAVGARLQAGDVVSMVTWNASNNVVLDGHGVTGPSDPVLLGACDGLSASGGTDLHSGLVAGYALAEANWSPGMTNRVILVSDGGANLGITDEQLIAEKAWLGDGRDIFMVGIGVGGAGGYNDLLMDTVTDAGRGASVFLPSATEAWDVLHDRFLEVFEVALTDVRLELELPERLRIVKASAEQISTNPDAVRPQYLAPNAEMAFYNELRTPVDACLDDQDLIVARATYTDAAGVAQVLEQQWTIGQLRALPHANALKGRAIQLYAEALAAPAGATRVQAAADALFALDAADTAWPADADLAEIRQVLNAL